MVTGLDIAAAMISAARQRVGDRDIEWIVGDAETYPPPEGHYDAIISQMGLTGSSEAPRLNCVACGSSSRYFCASGLMRWAASTSRRQTHPAGLATALCRRSRLSRLTIRVLELRRCNDWAQIQDRVSGRLGERPDGPTVSLCAERCLNSSPPG
jgi:hypothetical protein